MQVHQHYNRECWLAATTQPSNLPVFLSSVSIVAGNYAPSEINSVRIADLTIHAIESQLFAENAYILRREGQIDCVIVDPGFQHEQLIQYLKAESLRPSAILNTHGHSDHIAGNEAMKGEWPDIPLVIGRNDAYKLTDPQANLSAPFGAELISPPADLVVDEGQSIEFAGLKFDVIDTPGHSKGHVVFVYRGTPNVILGGDVLFHGGIGRTDFEDGSFPELQHSIQKKLFNFAPDTTVFPGHGPHTTIELEIAHNPFVGVPAGYQPAAS